MSTAAALTSLEKLLESFLERAVAAKQERLSVLGGLSDLDDLARSASDGSDITENLSDWFAEHNRMLDQERLRPADLSRIGDILGSLREELDPTGPAPPAVAKVRAEIVRWQEIGRAAGAKLVLKRGPEPQRESQEDSIGLIDRELREVVRLFEDLVGNKKHVLSVLDDCLSRAREQKNRHALLLSAFIIYSLKQRRYKEIGRAHV